MDINLQAALEKIKTGDIKSAMDQLHFMSSEIALINNQIEDIYTTLQKKVNLQSEKLNGSTAISKIGNGTVSTSDINVIGVGTLFKTDCSVGNLIKVGLETSTIDTIIDDTHLIVNIAFSNNSNQIYAIIKNSTQELLTGDYQFGELNGLPFNGVITQGSTLQQFGRMSNAQDVVNVQFVQRAVNPAMARALNAIQRDGDIIGDDNTDTLNYEFRNVNFSIDANSNLRYKGFIVDPDHVVNLQKMLDHFISYKSDACYANWYAQNKATATPQITIAGISLWWSLNKTPLQASDNFVGTSNPYFEQTSNGLKCLRECTILVSCGASNINWQKLEGENNAMVVAIYKNNQLFALGQELGNGSNAHNNYHGFSANAITTLHCVPNDLIVAGFGGLVYPDSLSYTSLAIVR